MTTPAPDPLQFFNAMASAAGWPLPGTCTPVTDINELDRRLSELKAVEGWLRMNLGILQGTIQTMEMQRTGLAAFETLMATAKNKGATEQINPNELAETLKTMWPWNMMAAGLDAAAELTSKANHATQTAAKPARSKKAATKKPAP